MRISALIKRLLEIRAEHGDLPVTAYDGMDPSDLDEVSRVEVSSDYYYPIDDNHRLAPGPREPQSVKLT